MQQLLYYVPEYQEDLVYKAVGAAFEQLNILSELTPETKVLLKPNLVMAKKPDAPVTTHPMVVKSVAAGFMNTVFRILQSEKGLVVHLLRNT